MAIFEGKGRRTKKMNLILSLRKEVKNTVFKFILQKSPYRLNESRKTGFGCTFSPCMGGSIWPIVSKNNTVHPREDPQQPCELHEKRFKNVICIVRSHTRKHIGM